MKKPIEKRTVAQSVIEVLQAAEQPMAISDITQAILDKNLYSFNAKNPKGIVREAVDRRCEGLNRKHSVEPKYFRKLPDGKYELINS